MIRIYALPAFALFISTTTPVLGAVPDADIIRCAGIMLDMDRLACFDALSVGVSAEAAAAAAGRKIASAEALRRSHELKTARRIDSFGAEQTGATKDDEKIDELSTSVSGSYKDAYGKYLLVLDNGQFWKQLDGTLLTIRNGDKVTLKRAALGSYRLNVERQKRTVSAKRIK